MNILLSKGNNQQRGRDGLYNEAKPLPGIRLTLIET